MGVTGLWRLIEPAGKPVPVETLENKVLAVDISIWLHQMVKGYQDAKGAPLPNAHLMGLFQRLCKLLYFRVKPVFVFDGGFPELKRETIAKRQDHKSKYNSESERLKRELALLLSKQTAVKSLLGTQISPKKNKNLDPSNDDIFKLPAIPQKDEESGSESEDETSSGSIIDLHSIDVESDNFKSLPVKEKYDLLVELKETRKMNSWGKLHELPKKSDNFSDFQMQRLLKRRKVQECLQETEKEMGDIGMSLNDLESLLNEEGIDTKIESLPTRRIAANNTTRYLLINNVKQALADAKKKELDKQTKTTNTETDEESSVEKINQPKKDELEDDLEKAIKMSLECCHETDTSINVSKTDDSWTSFVTESDYSDSEEEDGCEQPDMSSAKAYIMQYSDLTTRYIDNFTSKVAKNTTKSKSKVPHVDKIIEDLNTEKPIITDNISLSTDEDNEINVTVAHSGRIIEINSSPMVDNMDTTQASVMCVEKPYPETISLDSSTDEVNYVLAAKHSPPSTPISQSDSESKRNTVVSAESEVMEIIDSENDEEYFKNVTEFKTEQIESTTISTPKQSSDSESDDFEEVTDDKYENVIQLTLEVGKAPEDDIFADIFTDNKATVPVETNSTKVSLIPIESQSSDEIISVLEIKQCHKTLTPSKISDSKPKVVDQSLDKVEQNSKNELKTHGPIEKNYIIEPVASTGKRAEEENSVLKHFSETELSDGEGTSTQNVVKEIPKQIREPINTDTLHQMVGELQREEQDLLQEKGRLDRIGRNITEQMTKEAQELLQIFGIPYIVAPMEAEAQCAFLESVNLTHGTITDDSDIWLFGGRTVYKNFFNQKKHVLQFLAERIERSFNLTREQLILLALLVGSDYTTGVTGVGPVTALEILASFPFNKKQFINETEKQARYTHVVAGLQEFKKWVRAGKRTDNITLKKKLKNVTLSEEFPSVRVVGAYMEPNVEKNEEKFTWGELDITILRDYAKAKFGWSQSKLDEIVKPVIKRIQDRKTQKTVHDYFKRKIDFHTLDDQMSKRVKAAVQKMGPEGSLEDEGNLLEGKDKRIRKKKADGNDPKAGPSKPKQTKNNDEKVLMSHGVKIVSQTKESGKSIIEITIPKSDRVQEIIPQREKDKHNLLQNKLKAIEVFRKNTIDKKKKTTKRRVNLPKEKAELSESDSD